MMCDYVYLFLSSIMIVSVVFVVMCGLIMGIVVVSDLVGFVIVNVVLDVCFLLIMMI